jgi:hypothetical protein
VCGGIGLVCYSALSEGAHVNSTLKVQSPETVTLLEAKSKRMLFKRPKRLAKRFG